MNKAPIRDLWRWKNCRCRTFIERKSIIKIISTKIPTDIAICR